MTYAEATQYLFTRTPLFQHIGAGAYKEGLENTHQLDAHFGHPHRKYLTLHIAGTNGKGSCAHTLAAILQSAGYRTGLYTSPHLVDFRERIRVNGAPIPESEVVRFVEEERSFFEPLYPSFFEVTTALAFRYFAEQKVDIAVIEVGMGGRLDCTNIITPLLSIITNIGLDHTQFLGSTLAAIAGEKAGIMKAGVPVLIGETNAETAPLFRARAQQVGAPICFADAQPIVLGGQPAKGYKGIDYETTDGPLWGELGGAYQLKNTNTLLWACRLLKRQGLNLTPAAVQQGLAHVCELTGLRGRWEVVSKAPLTICDSGHNVAGLTPNMQQLKALPHKTLRICIGMVSDKDVDGVLAIMPHEAVYYFTQASVPRALPATKLATRALHHRLRGHSYPTVKEAVAAARREADTNDVIYIGGSNFVLADFWA